MNANVILAIAVLCGATAADAEPLTSDRAVEFALERNPELAALAADVGAARARLSGAELPLQSNPEISAGAGPRRNGAAHSTDLEVSLSQRVEVFGQRGARIDVAQAERAAAEKRLASRRVAVAAEVRSAFARVLAAERLVALAREDLAVARDAVRAVERRLELGGTSQLEVNAVRVEGGRAARSVAVATQRTAAARAELRTLLGSDAGAPLELAGELPRPPERLRSTWTRSSGARWRPEPTSPPPAASSRRPRPSSTSRRARRFPCPRLARGTLARRARTSSSAR